MNTETGENYLLRATGSFLLPTILVGAGIILSNFAFSLNSREIIKERDNYECKICGSQDGLNCSHINHDKRNPRYDDPSNGRLLCIVHHYLDHLLGEGKNGLSIQHNSFAKKSLWKRMDKDQRQQALKELENDIF